MRGFLPERKGIERRFLPFLLFFSLSFFHSFFSSSLFRFSNVLFHEWEETFKQRYHGRVYDLSITERKKEKEREREERESRSSRDSTNLIVMMDTSEVKSATTTPRNREGEKGIGTFPPIFINMFFCPNLLIPSPSLIHQLLFLLSFEEWSLPISLHSYPSWQLK